MTDQTSLDRNIAAATRALLDCQKPDGEWCFELEADCTIPSEYVLLRHYLGSLDNPALIVYRIVPSRVRFMREWALDYHDVPMG